MKTERWELVGRRQRTAWLEDGRERCEVVGWRRRAGSWFDGDGELGAGLMETES